MTVTNNQLQCIGFMLDTIKNSYGGSIPIGPLSGTARSLFLDLESRWETNQTKPGVGNPANFDPADARNAKRLTAIYVIYHCGSNSTNIIASPQDRWMAAEDYWNRGLGFGYLVAVRSESEKNTTLASVWQNYITRFHYDLTDLDNSWMNEYNSYLQARKNQKSFMVQSEDNFGLAGSVDGNGNNGDSNDGDFTGDKKPKKHYKESNLDNLDHSKWSIDVTQNLIAGRDALDSKLFTSNQLLEVEMSKATLDIATCNPTQGFDAIISDDKREYNSGILLANNHTSVLF